MNRHTEAGTDIIVIGGGLIGSAAARHLAEAGHRITVVTSPEPDHYGDVTGPLASHYDQGRITRIADTDPFWAEAAQQSIGRYRDIEMRSGIDFYTPRPLLYVSSDAATIVEVATSFGADARLVTPAWMRDNTPIRMPSGATGDIGYEAAPAGHINPRQMVKAQLRLAAQAGASIIDQPATAVEHHHDSVTVRCDPPAGTKTGAIPTQSVTGQQLLLTTGPYGAELVGIDRPLRRDLRTVAMIQPPPHLAAISSATGEAEAADLLPNVIMSELNRPNCDGIYWVPPVLYPDGKPYLKIGMGSDATRHAATSDDLAQWFRSGGDPDEVAELVEVAGLILGQPVKLGFSQPCVVAHGPDERPIFERLTPTVVAAFAGSGAAAKSSDELGRRAADLITGV